MAYLRPVGLAVLLTVVTATAAAASPQSDAADAPAPQTPSLESLERIGRQLTRPGPGGLQIVLPEEPPTFRVEVHEHLYWTDEPPVSQFKVPPMIPLVAPQSPGEPGMGAAGGGVGIDPYKTIAAVRHFFQQRAAEKEVREVVAELCAVTACPAR